MLLIIAPDGAVRAVYDERIDLATLGRPAIARASHVEPAADGSWHADLSPVAGRGSWLSRRRRCSGCRVGGWCSGWGWVWRVTSRRSVSRRMRGRGRRG